MKQLLPAALIVTLLFSVSSHAQTFKAAFLNPNVYRSYIDFKVVRIADGDFDAIAPDTFSVVVKRIDGSGLDFLDYKVINENVNGYTIIQFIPLVEFGTISKTTKVKKTTGYIVKDGEVRPIIDESDITKETKTIVFSKNESLATDKNPCNYYFAVKADAFKPMSQRLMAVKLVGVPIVHPFKLRPRSENINSRLATDVSISYNFGIRLRLGSNPFKQNFFTIIPYGIGIGAAKYFTKKEDGSLTASEDQAAVTYYQGGILFTVEKINFGVFGGRDAMISSRNDWFYQGKTWYSFGIGYKFGDK